ncbi:tigger transposable element-derived protein 4-like [Melanaphis sacchari]|uniref:tigger transposable element-derived protein 4-like n=1 Tax=Melanaphis sacchari TaxID=742174 RepID=UPI000DC15655|nr:tigger transposable element-derived protein 4-like [Melanaphis sacchari]
MSKRKQFTIEEKANIIFRLKIGEKNSDIANELDVGHSTISNTWKVRDKIEQEFQNEKLSVKKLRNGTHTDLDNKANELAEGLGKHNFNCSTGWIQRFRARHIIVFSTINGESNSVNTEITQNWIEKVWPKLREGYTDDQIYNADETGLFYKMLPNRTLKFKGEKCSGGKMSKERLTVLVSASMTVIVRLFFNHMINNIENKIEANISVLDGILMIFKAWEKVSEITIRNCFRHAGINNTIPQQTVQGEQEEDISFPNINEYINFDNDVLTSEPLSDQEIISSLINQPEEPEEDDNSEEADTPDGDLSINAVFNAVKMLANYMALNNVSPKINFEELEKTIERDFYTNKVQSKITDFFK